MNKPHILLLLTLLTGLQSSDSGNNFSNSIFLITPPKFDTKSDGLVVTLMMPASGGFSPNVNVMVQSFAMGVNEYDKITQSQIKNMKFQIIESKIQKMKFYMNTQGNPVQWTYIGMHVQLNLKIKSI